MSDKKKNHTYLIKNLNQYVLQNKGIDTVIDEEKLGFDPFIYSDFSIWKNLKKTHISYRVDSIDLYDKETRMKINELMLNGFNACPF